MSEPKNGKLAEALALVGEALRDLRDRTDKLRPQPPPVVATKG